MLRYLEQQGIVVPRRTPAGYRGYGLPELNRLRTLRELRLTFGLGIDEIAFAARLPPPPARAPRRRPGLARRRCRQQLVDRVGAAQARAAARGLITRI